MLELALPRSLTEAPHRPFVLLAVVSSLLVGCDASDDGPARESGFNPVGSVEPFTGTVFPEPDLLTDASPSDFAAVTGPVQGSRRVFDGRAKRFVDIDARVFTATFDGGGTLEIVVNEELAETASAEAEAVSRRFGTLPRALRQDVDAVWVHAGDVAWQSADRALVIHVGRTETYEAAGIVEEILLHESVHVSLDPTHERAAGWLAAQRADERFISTHARENPDTEDLAETFLAWLAARHLGDRVDPTTVRLVEETIPARLVYLDRQGFDLGPTVP